MKALGGVSVLLSAMSRKVSRDEAVLSHIESGAGYLREIDALVREAAAQQGRDVSPREAAEFVFERLGLPRAGLIPVVLRSMQAHLDEGSM